MPESMTVLYRDFSSAELPLREVAVAQQDFMLRRVLVWLGWEPTQELLEQLQAALLEVRDA